MHEMTIAVEVFRQLEALAAEHDLARITAVKLQAGVMRSIVPEALDIAFESLAEGTLASGATLTLDVVPCKARCRACGKTFSPTPDSFLCPVCQLADVEIVQGNEILLQTVEGE